MALSSARGTICHSPGSGPYLANSSLCWLHRVTQAHEHLRRSGLLDDSPPLPSLKMVKDGKADVGGSVVSLLEGGSSPIW